MTPLMDFTLFWSRAAAKTREAESAMTSQGSILPLSSMFPPSSSLFLSLSLSPSAERERVRERAIAGVGQGLLTVRIWLQCVNCFILKTLKLMPVRASGGLLRVRASEFLKVESGRGWRRAETARKRRRIVTTFTEARKNPSIRRHDTAALRLCPR